MADGLFALAPFTLKDVGRLSRSKRKSHSFPSTEPNLPFPCVLPNMKQMCTIKFLFLRHEGT